MSGVGIRGVVLWVNFFVLAFIHGCRCCFSGFFWLRSSWFLPSVLVIAGGVFVASFVVS
jgi:hypothetical protein